jgi:hypothetical protein
MLPSSSSSSSFNVVQQPSTYHQSSLSNNTTRSFAKKAKSFSIKNDDMSFSRRSAPKRGTALDNEIYALRSRKATYSLLDLANEHHTRFSGKNYNDLWAALIVCPINEMNRIGKLPELLQFLRDTQTAIARDDGRFTAPQLRSIVYCVGMFGYGKVVNWAGVTATMKNPPPRELNPSRRGL